MQEGLDIVFGTGSSSVSGQVGPQAQENFALSSAQNGAFLDDVPSRQELAAVMETNLKNWVVS